MALPFSFPVWVVAGADTIKVAKRPREAFPHHNFEDQRLYLPIFTSEDAGSAFLMERQWYECTLVEVPSFVWLRIILNDFADDGVRHVALDVAENATNVFDIDALRTSSP